MAQTIKLKRSGTQNAVPSTSQLALGEVAINTYDGKMYIKKNDGSDSIVEIGGDATSSSGLDFTGNLNLADNVRIVIGDGNDLQIYHDGSHSYIEDSGTGNLYLNTTNGGGVFLTSAGENLAAFYSNGAVNLYYDNAAKLATTSSGIDVTGNINLEQTTSSNGRLNFSNSTHTGWDWQQFENSNGELIVTISGTGGAEFQFDGDGSDYTNARFNVGGANVTATTIGNWNTAYTYSQVGHLPLTGGSLSGRLLINTASSIDNLSQLHIVGYTSGRAGITLQDGDSTTQKTFFTQSSGTTRFNTQNGTSYGSFVVGGWNGTTSADFVTVKASGNVGIGTTSPSEKLEVNGRLKVQAGDAATSAYSIISNGGDLVLKAGADDVVLRTGGSGSEGIYFQDGAQDTKMFINAENGNVGIGTTSPQKTLHTLTSADIVAQFESSDAGARILIKDTTTSGYINASNSKVSIGQTDGLSANNLNIDASGNVGIGTTSPNRLLHVAGNSRFTGGSHTFGDSTQTSTNIDIIATNTDGAPATATSIKFQGYESRAQGLFFTDVGEANKEWFIGLPYGNGSLTAFQIGYDNDSNAQPEYAAHSLFRVLNNGNVGIGTDSPASKLEVKSTTPVITVHATTLTGTTLGDKGPKLLFKSDSSTAGNGGEIVFAGGGDTNVERWAAISGHISSNTVNGCAGHLVFATKENSTDTSLTERMRIENGGNVGIGTDNPSRKLDVVAAAQDGIRIASTNAFIGGGASGGDAQLLYWNGSNVYYGRSSLGGSVSNHYFRTGGTTRLQIEADGNVGVGTFLTSQPNANSQTNLNAVSPLHVFKQVSSGGTETLLTLETYRGDYNTTPGKIALDFKGQDSNNAENFARIAHATVNDTDYGDNNEGTSNLIFGMTKNGTYNERMILTGAGRLGLGTLNPGAPLHITETGAGGDTVRIESTNSGTGQAQTFGPALALVRTQTSEADGDRLGALRFFGQNSSNVSYEYARIETTSDDVTDGTEDGGLNFYVSANGSLVEKASISPYGLFVNTTSSIDNSAQLQIQGNTSGYARITMQDIDGTNTKTFFTQSAGTTQITTQNGSDGGVFKVSTWDGSSTSDRVIVDGNGDVGINTAPDTSAKLRVGGTIATTSGSISSFGNLTASNGYVKASSASATLGYWLGSTQIIDGDGKILSLDAKSHSALEKPVYDGTNSGSYIYSADHNYVSNIPDHDNWHDVFSFRRFYSWTYETSTDGSSFSSATISNVPFDQKDSTAYELLNSTIKAARWTITGVNYADIKYLGVGVNYSASAPAVDVKVETSSDGTTWSNLGGSTVSGEEGNNRLSSSAISYLLRLGSNGLSGNTSYIRITITKQTISNTNSWDLAYLRAWGNRPGDQGKGKEYMVPYDYHERQYIRLTDNQELQLGAGGDAQMAHTGSFFYLDNDVGSILIRQQQNDQDVVIQSDNGSGGLADYFRADGSTGNTRLYHYGTEKFTTTAKGIQVSGVSSTFADGTHSFAEFIANADHRALLKIKNSNTNATAGATRAGLDLDAANHEDSTRLHAILDVRSRTSAGNGGDANLTVPYDFSIYTDNKDDLTLNDGDQASAAVPGGTLALHIDENQHVGVGTSTTSHNFTSDVGAIGSNTYAGHFIGSLTYTPPNSGTHNQVSNGVLIQAGGFTPSGTSYALMVQDRNSTELFAVNGNTGAVRFHDAFTFPTSDGSANQVLKTNGSGTVTWADQSGGATLSNGADNRVVTASGANTLNGEANMTFDGSLLTVTGKIKIAGSDPVLERDQYDYLDFDDDSQTYTGGTNATVLSSVSDVAIRTNTNDGGGGLFTIVTGTSSPSQMLQINTSGDATFAGSVSAVTKSFDIEHPTKPGMRLHHGSLEGPEHGVYVRGHATENVIELPEYWTGLIDKKTITVQLTANGRFQKLYVEKVENNKVYLRNASWFSNKIDCYYMINATRKDIEKFEVEYGNS